MEEKRRGRSERIGAIREYQIEKSNFQGGEERPATKSVREMREGGAGGGAFATTKKGRTSAISVTQGGRPPFLETHRG